MKMGRIVLGLVLSMGLSVAVHAKATNLGPLSDGATRNFNNGFSTSQSFADTVSFTVTSLSDIVDGSFTAFGISDFKIALNGGTPIPGILGDESISGTYSFADLAPGTTYTFDISGKSSSVGGSYGSVFEVTAAVPEADTWLMIIIGVGLVAYQLRRKQKALVRTPLLQG